MQRVELKDGWARFFDGEYPSAEAIALELWPDLKKDKYPLHFAVIASGFASFATPTTPVVSCKANHWFAMRRSGGATTYSCVENIPEEWIERGDGLTKLTRTIIKDWMMYR